MTVAGCVVGSVEGGSVDRPVRGAGVGGELQGFIAFRVAVVPPAKGSSGVDVGGGATAAYFDSGEPMPSVAVPAPAGIFSRYLLSASSFRRNTSL